MLRYKKPMRLKGGWGAMEPASGVEIRRKKHPSIMNALSEFVNIEKISHCYVLQFFHLKSSNLAYIFKQS